jgi:hypothetical protein
VRAMSIAMRVVRWSSESERVSSAAADFSSGGGERWRRYIAMLSVCEQGY